jgi:hypothetical protein
MKEFVILETDLNVVFRGMEENRKRIAETLGLVRSHPIVTRCLHDGIRKFLFPSEFLSAPDATLQLH